MSEPSITDSADPEGYAEGVAQPREHTSRIIAITSGKGGVGKTNVTTNLGIALAMRGDKVCIFDADTSLANINILLGLTPTYTLEHFLNGEKTLEEIAVEGPRGVTIIPAASGIADYAQLDPDRQRKLLDALEVLEREYDYVLIDTAAGVGDTVLAFVQSAQYAVVVISPEPTSLTDAFALVKVLKKKGFDRPIYALVNMVSNFHNSMDIFKRFQAAVQKYLDSTVRYLGYITLDETVISSIHLQRPVILAEPQAAASRCFHTLAEGIGKNFRFSGTPHSLSGYWKDQRPSSATPPEPAQPPAAEPAWSPQPATPAAAPPTEQATSPAAAALEFVNRQETDAEQAKAMLEPLVEAFIDRFQRFPLDLRHFVYRSLELGDFPEDEIKDLVTTLETLYERRCQRPVRDTEDTLIKLLADAHTSEGKMAALGRQLQAGFERQFHKKLFDPEVDLRAAVQRGDYDENRFGELIQSLRDAYLEHSGRRYEDERDRMLHDVRQIALRMEEQEGSLRNGLTRLSEWFNDTVAAREDLLSRIKDADRDTAVPEDDDGQD
ncbi:MAG: MinD/ParA family protein [Gammaproteobacteria bacterium]